MTARDFCYWLQGYFEIAGGEALGLNETRVKIVRAHLAMVAVHDRSTGKARSFCDALRGALELLDLDVMINDQVARLRASLHDVFEHEIDPSFPTKEQAALSAAHASFGTGSHHGGMIRC